MTTCAPTLPCQAKWRIIIGQMAHTETVKSARTPRGRQAVRSSVARAKDSGLKRFRRFLETGSAGANSYVVLLGLETFDSPQLLRSVEHGLPYSAFERLVANTSFATDDALALVNIPLRTLTRR